MSASGQEAFGARLARLRRDGDRSSRGPEVRAAPDVPVASEAPRDPLPSWLGRSLARRAAGTSRIGESAPDAALERAAQAWETTVGDPGDLVEVGGAHGSFAARTRRFELAELMHGDWRLDELEHVDTQAIARLAKDDELKRLDLRDAVYLDTETSGLGGGAGTYVYMVGLGWFEGTQWVSWQGFLRHPGEERALLADVAERIAGRSSVVSFFGKSFDRHRLEDKMKICGVEAPFDSRPHLDLYYPFRRLARGAFGDGKLQTLERALLGFVRERDLPGALAPAAWFDYLAKRPHRLEGVFQHNHEDVLSLCALSAHLGRALAEERQGGASLSGPADRRAVAFAETGTSPADACQWAERALARGVEGDDKRRMQLLIADHYRRTKDTQRARVAYREALEECATDRVAITLFVGAAMLLEHQLRDTENACGMAERALVLARAVGASKGEVASIEKRLVRLRSVAG